MTKPVAFTARVTGGKLPRPVAEEVASALARLDGLRAVVTVAEAPKPRRPNKRKYYFAVVVRNVCLALRDAGNAIDEEGAHTLLKQEVGKLRQVVVLPDGEIKYTLRSYRDLTPKEEGDYLAACTAWCAEMGIDCPPPDPFHHTANQEKEALCPQA